MQDRLSKIDAFIFARSGSKGLINKNIRIFHNNPLIAHTIIRAKESNLFQNIIVSTDSQRIKEIAESYGAIVPFIRPKELATDKSNELLSWKHCIDNLNDISNCFVSLPCTCPLRDYGVIKKMIKFYHNNDFDLVTGIIKSNVSPEFNMVFKEKDDSIIKIINNKRNIGRRQDATDCYIVTTYAYITSPKYIMSSKSILDGRVGGYLVDKNESIDIDDINDFEYAEYLFKKGMIDE